MNRVFLSLSNLEGHRQVYCRELCDYLLSRDFSVTVATDLTGLQKCAALKMLTQHPRVRFVPDTWTAGDRATAQLRALVAAAREAAANVTFLAEADLAHGLISAQIARPRLRLPGRRVGLFIRSTNYVHEVNYPQAGRVARMIERPVLAAYGYLPLSLAQQRLFHEVVMRHCAVLDAALCLDEVFATIQGGPYGWLPDIAVASEDGSEGSSTEAATWEAEVSAFLATQNGRPVVVCTGESERRRGYEALLRLADHVGGCYINCGKSSDSSGYPDEALGAKAALASRSALLEFGDFYQSFETARVTLAAAKCVVLPYAAHLGSSGVMLQALMAGRPVLVPDQGLMAWRVRNFGLGLTFAPGDWRDMRYKFSVLQNTPPEVFADRIRRFLAYFSRAQFEAAMDGALGLSRVAACLPSAEEIEAGWS